MKHHTQVNNSPQMFWQICCLLCLRYICEEILVFFSFATENCPAMMSPEEKPHPMNNPLFVKIADVYSFLNNYKPPDWSQSIVPLCRTGGWLDKWFFMSTYIWYRDKCMWISVILTACTFMQICICELDSIIHANS